MLKKIIAPPYYIPIKNPDKYQALITQTGTNPPVPFIIRNEIGTVTWTRGAQGVYHATFQDILTTICTITVQQSGQLFTIVTAAYNGTGAMQINCYNVASGLVDGALVGAYVEITRQQVIS